MLQVPPRPRRFGPADAVTSVRAGFTVAVAVLAGVLMAGTAGQVAVAALVVLAAAGLVLDTVDGQVARRTGTASAFGARFDQEADAALILVLSAYVGWQLDAPWVWAIGLMRYAAGAVRVGLPRLGLAPWLRGSAPPRRWAKVVAGVQGVVLTVAASGLLPRAVCLIALVVALGLLVESFGHEIASLRPAGGREADGAVGPARPRLRVIVPAAAVLVAAASLPDRPDRLGPAALLGLPVELLLLLTVGIGLPRRPRRVAAGTLGLLLAVVLVLHVLDLGFQLSLARPVDPASDASYLRSGAGVLADTVGRPAAALVVAVLAVALVLVLVGVPWAARRVADASAARPRGVAVALAVLAPLWLAADLLGDARPGWFPAGGVATGRLVAAADQVRAGLRDRPVFAAALADDRFAVGPPGAGRVGGSAGGLLTGLRGKDVLLVFVESYGRVALTGPTVAPLVTPTLDDGTRRLRAAGVGVRTGMLTSTTFGGASWLAHATFQSGLRVDGQRRYEQLLASDRTTLTSAFTRAGWRTVFVAPANREPWPQASTFYRAARAYGAGDLGYAGRASGYTTMPDQYTLAALHRLELARRDRPPVMAEVDLVSSHFPWPRPPDVVPWEQVGDGAGLVREPPAPPSGDVTEVRRAYGRTVAYSLDALVSFVLARPDPDLVLIVLGDHQPVSQVSADGAPAGRISRDVPVSVIARDPAVLGRIGAWEWVDGLRPSPSTPAVPMEDFRDRFLTAFSTDRSSTDRSSTDRQVHPERRAP